MEFSSSSGFSIRRFSEVRGAVRGRTLIFDAKDLRKHLLEKEECVCHFN